MLETTMKLIKISTTFLVKYFGIILLIINPMGGKRELNIMIRKAEASAQCNIKLNIIKNMS